MLDSLLNLGSRFGSFVVGGVIGAVVHRLRNEMSWKRFFSTVAISGFVGLSVGILFRNYFDAPQEVIFVACSVAGVFSKDLLNETQEIIKLITSFVKKKTGV